MKELPKIWLITGVSTGLGRALALEAAKAGHTVYGTLRKQEQVNEFDALVPGRTFGILLDVNRHGLINPAIRQIIDKHSKIDILVNNAGYGLFGAIEEISMEEARSQMETNFFSVLALTQAVLPYMREQRSGHIIQISSMSGIKANSATGLYNASKFALEGLSEALYYEVKPLGVHVTLVEPGPFRTLWAGASSVRAARVIPDYESTVGTRIRALEQMNGTQPGDPAKGALAILKAARSADPPLRLALGKFAIQAIREKYRSAENELTEWESIGSDTDFDD